MKKIITIIGIFGLILVQAQKVGINTDDPKATLDIKSEGNANDTKAFKITNNKGDEMVVVGDGGNVAIGTKNQPGILDLTGDIRLKGKHDGSNIIVFEDISATGTKGNQWQLYPDKNGFGLYNRTNRKYAVKFANSGNVGIGTSYPTTKLDVRGQVRIGTLNDAADTDNVKVLVTGADGVVKTKSISSLQAALGGQIITRGRTYTCDNTNLGNRVIGVGVYATCMQIHPEPHARWWLTGYSHEGKANDTWLGWRLQNNNGVKLQAGINLVKKTNQSSPGNQLGTLIFHVIDDSQYQH